MLATAPFHLWLNPPKVSTWPRSVARAMVNRPEILLADEPTGNLDSRMGTEIMRLLTDLNRTGITVLMVTHNATCAAYARRQIVFRDGRVASDDRSAAS